jgi:hypothetical protein
MIVVAIEVYLFNIIVMLNLNPRFCSIASSVDTIGFVSLFMVDIIHAHQRENNLKTSLTKFFSVQLAGTRKECQSRQL